MTLSRSSKLARWCYQFRKMPKKTTLCAFFWQCFVIVPLVWLVIVGLIGAWLYFIVKPHWFEWGAGLGTIGLIGGLAYVFAERIDQYFIRQAEKTRQRRSDRYYQRLRNEERPPTAIDRFFDTLNRIFNSIFVQGLMSLKKKFCPIIELKD